MPKIEDHLDKIVTEETDNRMAARERFRKKESEVAEGLIASIEMEDHLEAIRGLLYTQGVVLYEILKEINAQRLKDRRYHG